MNHISGACWGLAVAGILMRFQCCGRRPRCPRLCIARRIEWPHRALLHAVADGLPRQSGGAAPSDVRFVGRIGASQCTFRGCPAGMGLVQRWRYRAVMTMRIGGGPWFVLQAFSGVAGASTIAAWVRSLCSAGFLQAASTLESVALGADSGRNDVVGSAAPHRAVMAQLVRGRPGLSARVAAAPALPAVRSCQERSPVTEPSNTRWCTCPAP
ncbi:hypothetical protein LMG9673_04027 [Ralstonia pseudosolanacearum]|nr:hypothetical protein LMG9673_04027 [Ralstonia pseudosolanacearum]